MKAYHLKYNKRLLDYYDNHLHPHGDNVWSDNNDPATNALRLRSTQCLWNPNYVDESWIKYQGPDHSKIYFIPRMKKMVADNYPDTKVAITEYCWGGTKVINGALAQADVLGIFGREGLDMAAIWNWGELPTDPWAYAFRMYRNYDGKGSQFGDTSVMAKSSDEQHLSIYASLKNMQTTLTIMVINKDPSFGVKTNVTIHGFKLKKAIYHAKIYTYSAVNLSKIIEGPKKLIHKSFSYEFPAYSITLFDIKSK